MFPQRYDTSIRVHAAVTSDACKNARARRGRTSRWTAAGLAAVLAMPLPQVSAAETDLPATQPMPFQKPLYWGNLPPPMARVHLKTSFGTITLPMGYLSDWFVLRDQPAVTASDGLRQFSGGLHFQFEYPSGGMNANFLGETRMCDNGQACASNRHVLPGRTAVFIEEVAPFTERYEGGKARTLGATIPSGTLVLNDTYSGPDNELLDGVTESDSGHRIGVELHCGVNCIFEFYLERQHLIMHGVMNGGVRHESLVIAKQAHAMFEQWQTPARIESGP